MLTWSSFSSHPSSLEQLPAKLLRGVVEGELLAADVIDRRVAVQVEKEVVIEPNLLWFLLKDSSSPANGEQVGTGADVWPMLKRNAPCF